MRYAYALIGMLAILLLVAGCAWEAAPAQPPPAEPAAPPAALTDEQVLQQHDDGLDAALQDLDLLGE